MTTRTLRGDHCVCRECDEFFNSTAAFDAHRTGEHGVDRRCMSAAEMRAVGMAVSSTGWWVTRLRPVLGQTPGPETAGEPQ